MLKPLASMPVNVAAAAFLSTANFTLEPVTVTPNVGSPAASDTLESSPERNVP